jgi:hypothetical protein
MIECEPIQRYLLRMFTRIAINFRASNYVFDAITLAGVVKDLPPGIPAGGSFASTRRC